MRYLAESGEELRSEKILRGITWRADDKAAKHSWSSDFRIAPHKAPFQVLFGKDFVDSERIYTFNKAALVLTKKKKTKG